MELLNSKRDPMGQAIHDYFVYHTAKKLIVASDMFDDDEMPVAHLFRTEDEMNVLERSALSLCKGNVLDVGAGAGCHSLALQNKKNISVSAIDKSALSVEIMRRRGVLNCNVADFFDKDMVGRYDVILMLMNGLGIVGNLERLPVFFEQVDRLLTDDGFVLADSSDLRYVFEDEDGNFDPIEFDYYYGELEYEMRYGQVKGERFPWLYIDFLTLNKYAELSGFSAEVVRWGDHYDYLAKIKRV